MTTNTLDTRLRKLMKKFNPAGVNLHFEGFLFGDVDLLPALAALLRDLVNAAETQPGCVSDDQLAAIQKTGGHALWYDLFLATSAGAVRIADDKAAAYIPPEIVRDLVVALVQLAPFSHADGGDLCKRNYEAIANVLVTFYDTSLLRLARAMAKKLGAEAKWVVRVAIDKAESARMDRRHPDDSHASSDSKGAAPRSIDNIELRIPDSAKPPDAKT